MNEHRISRRAIAGASLLAGMSAPLRAATQATPEGDTRIVTDYLDREIDVPVHPQRVLTMSLPILEIALAVGIKPVGSAGYATLDGFPEFLKDQVDGIELVGDKEWDLEKIITLDPDIAILDYFGEKDDENLALLEQIVPVVTVGKFREEWRQDSAIVAEALNTREEFVQIEKHYDARITELNEKLSSTWAGKTVALLRFRAGDMRLLKSNSFAGTVLADLDLSFPDITSTENGIAEDFSLEQAQLIDVDALFVVHDAGPEANESLTNTLESPVFQLLDVVKRGNVYQVDQEAWIALRGYGAAEVILADIEWYLVNGEPGIGN